LFGNAEMSNLEGLKHVSCNVMKALFSEELNIQGKISKCEKW